MVQDENLYDVIVIGGGPAGLTAGLYLARARYRVLILEKADFGGQITITDEVVNYPGVGTTSGRALTATMRRQAQDFGAEFLSAEATGLDVEGDVKVVHTSRGDLRTFGILVATGASPRKLGFEGESEYAGRGVAYCATCDGEFFTGREVLVIGGGFAAAEEAVFSPNTPARSRSWCARTTSPAMRRWPPRRRTTRRSRCATTPCSTASPPGRAADRGDDPRRGVRGRRDVAAVRGAAHSASSYSPVTCPPPIWCAASSNLTSRGRWSRTAIWRPRCRACMRRAICASRTYGRSSPRRPTVQSRPWNWSGTPPQMSERTGLVPPRPVDSAYERRERDAAASAARSGTSPAPAPTRDGGSADAASGAVGKSSGFFNDAIRKQLDVVFGRMARPVTLRLDLDGSPLSAQLDGFIGELASLGGGKIAVERHTAASDAAYDPAGVLPEALPCVRMCVADGDGDVRPTGLAFHGVPSGHEFNSFVLGLYNAAGPGQALDADATARIAAIKEPVNIMLLVSLTCHDVPGDRARRAAHRRRQPAGTGRGL